MLEPRPPVQGRRRDRFRPPHCPWKECADHFAGDRYRATSNGSYRRFRDPQRAIPRFKCPTCGRTFSREAFSTSYYLKRPELLLPIANLLVSGCAHRQIARHLGCAPSTVTRLSVRLGEHARQFQEVSAVSVGPIQEPVVLDHFETFVRSQQERLGIATAVGQASWFVYPLQGAGYLRLKGRSRRKRALKRQPTRPLPGAVLDSTLKALENLLRLSPAGLDLVSDDHPAYRAAVRRLTVRRTIRHRIHANPDRTPGHDSTRARARDRAMYAVDLLHKLLRHSQAHHRRETIAFGRKRASVLGRAAIFAVWRNMIKLVSERRPTRLTPAMQLGLTSRPWTWGEVFAERLFERRVARMTT
jgi:transposase-like protein